MMQQNLKLQVLGGRKTTVEGRTFAKIYAGQTENSDNHKGIQVMTINCDPEVIDRLDANILPAELDVRIRMQVAGGGKAGMHVMEITKPRQETRAGAK